MRLAELCAATGVPSATVKYYLREGLLPAGEWVSARRAEYGPEHVERLRLIRALVDGAQLSIDGVRRIVEAIEQPPPSQHDFFGVAQQAINGPPPEVEVAEETLEALRRLGWSGCEPLALAHLQAALDTAARAGFAVTGERLVAYGQALRDVAQYDLDALMADPAVADAERRAASRRGRDRRHGPRSRRAAATGPRAGERTTLRRGFRPRRRPRHLTRVTGPGLPACREVGVARLQLLGHV